MENKYYIYFHINPLKNEVFYVGKGHGKRAYCKYKRSKLWNNIVNKYSYIIDIVETGLTKEEANLREKFYISKIGRRDLGLGPLVNHTFGGDGGAQIVTKEVKDKISKALKGVKKPLRSEEHKINISIAKKGIKHKPHSKAARKKMSDSAKGKKKSSEHIRKISETLTIYKTEEEKLERKCKARERCKLYMRAKRQKISQTLKNKNL